MRYDVLFMGTRTNFQHCVAIHENIKKGCKNEIGAQNSMTKKHKYMTGY